MKAKFRLVGNLLFIVLAPGILFSYAMFQGGFVSWFLFYSFLPILIYQLLLLYLPIKKWSVRRDLSHRILQAGESMQASVRLERKTHFPFYYVVVEELLPDTLNRKHRIPQAFSYLNAPEKEIGKRRVKEMVPIGFKKEVDIPYQLDNLPRGEHKLRAIRIRISDIFGFVKKEHIFPVEDEVIVHPNQWSIRLMDRAISFEQGQTAVNHFQLQQTTIATGVREYAPGDRLSWIDWKQTARNQKVMTKEFEQEHSNHLLLVLDACWQQRFNPLAFEASIELAATLIGEFSDTTPDIEFLTIGSETRSFSMKASRRSQEEVKRYLTRIQPGGKKPFSHVLKETLQHQMRLNRVIILTTALDELFRNTVQMLQIKGVHLVILYIQGSEMMSLEEKEWTNQMKKDGMRIQVITEKELGTTPLEVSM